MEEGSQMAVAVGVDVAKELHWAAIVQVETGKVLVSRKVANEPAAIQELIEQIRAVEAEHGPATVAIDVVGGIAGAPPRAWGGPAPERAALPGRRSTPTCVGGTCCRRRRGRRVAEHPNE